MLVYVTSKKLKLKKKTYINLYRFNSIGCAEKSSKIRKNTFNIIINKYHQKYLQKTKRNTKIRKSESCAAPPTNSISKLN